MATTVLLRSLALRRCDMLAQRLVDAAVGRPGHDAVIAIGHAWREMVRDHPGLNAAAVRYPRSGDSELEAAAERIHQVLSRTFSAYDLDDGDEDYAARALRSALHGFTHLESVGEHPLAHDLDETFKVLMYMLCAGTEQLCCDSGSSSGL